MRAADIELKAEGVVRVMHADKGMGVEFTQTTAEHRALLEKFLSMLSENRDMLPELMVEPEGLETEQAAKTTPGESGEANDPLLEMFRNQSSLPPDAFLAELRKKRGVTAAAAGD
jgi:hypothetical protein